MLERRVALIFINRLDGDLLSSYVPKSTLKHVVFGFEFHDEAG